MYESMSESFFKGMATKHQTKYYSAITLNWTIKLSHLGIWIEPQSGHTVTPNAPIVLIKVHLKIKP